MRTKAWASAAALVVAMLGVAACDDGGSTYDKSDPMPAETQAPSSVTPNPGLSGAGQNLSPPPTTDENGINSGEEETGKQGH